MRKNRALIIFTVLLLAKPIVSNASAICYTEDSLSLSGYVLVAVDRIVAKSIKKGYSGREKKFLIDYKVDIYFVASKTCRVTSSQMRRLAQTISNQQDSLFILLRPQAYLDQISNYCFEGREIVVTTAQSLPSNRFRTIKRSCLNGKRVAVYWIEGTFLVFKANKCMKNLLGGSFPDQKNYKHILIPLKYKLIQKL
jgi:hypothetical protein